MRLHGSFDELDLGRVSSPQGRGSLVHMVGQSLGGSSVGGHGRVHQLAVRLSSGLGHGPSLQGRGGSRGELNGMKCCAVCGAGTPPPQPARLAEQAPAAAADQWGVAATLQPAVGYSGTLFVPQQPHCPAGGKQRRGQRRRQLARRGCEGALVRGGADAGIGHPPCAAGAHRCRRHLQGMRHGARVLGCAGPSLPRADLPEGLGLRVGVDRAPPPPRSSGRRARRRLTRRSPAIICACSTQAARASATIMVVSAVRGTAGKREVSAGCGSEGPVGAQAVKALLWQGTGIPPRARANTGQLRNRRALAAGSAACIGAGNRI
jgi:hypothetical protein